MKCKICNKNETDNTWGVCDDCLYLKHCQFVEHTEQGVLKTDFIPELIKLWDEFEKYLDLELMDIDTGDVNGSFNSERVQPTFVNFIYWLKRKQD